VVDEVVYIENNGIGAVDQLRIGDDLEIRPQAAYLLRRHVDDLADVEGIGVGDVVGGQQLRQGDAQPLGNGVERIAGLHGVLGGLVWQGGLGGRRIRCGRGDGRTGGTRGRQRGGRPGRPHRGGLGQRCRGHAVGRRRAKGGGGEVAGQRGQQQDQKWGKNSAH